MNNIDLNNFQLINAASGDANLAYKGNLLHCNVNPQQEAITEFQKLKIATSKDIVIIVGLGLGYLLKRVFISSKCKIIIYEPNEEILKFSREAVAFSEEMQSGRVFFTSAFNELSGILANIYDYKSNISILKLKSADLLYSEEIKNLLFELPKIEANLTSNYTTLCAKSFTWLYNELYKLKSEEPYKPDFVLNILENKFKDKTALIVSAGPSLDKNIDIIKNNRDKFIIFCVNVAYKKLILNGIIPDFTIYIDAGGFLPTIKNYEHANTNVINHFTSFAKIFEDLNPKRFFTFYCKNDLLSRWIAKQADFSIDKYETKGSVSHLALVCAFNMGCNPIILTGQDLAYTDGKYYSSGSFWSEGAENKEALHGKIEALKNSAIFDIKGQNGEILKTSADYAGFIQYFEEFARENNSFVKLINCSTGGAQINGFENKQLEDVSDGLDFVNLDINSALDSIVQTEPDPVRQNHDKIHAQVEIFAEDVKKFKNLAENGVKYAGNLGRELKKRPINSARVSKLSNKILVLFNEIDDGFFKKWDFAIYIAFKELLEFYALLDDEEAQTDASIFVNLYEISFNFFDIIYKRLEKIAGIIIK